MVASASPLSRRNSSMGATSSIRNSDMLLERMFVIHSNNFYVSRIGHILKLITFLVCDTFFEQITSHF
jgi:hypothetical protein